MSGLGEASWFALPVDLARDPKMMRLRRELKNPCADAYLLRLWAWAKLYAPPSGDLVAFDTRDLEDACLWSGESGKLVEALTSTGWIDRGCLTGWHDLNGWLAIRAEKDRERKRAERTTESLPKRRASR